MKKKLAILGSTGSIGKTLLNIVNQDKKKFEITLLSTNKNLKKIFKQAKEHKVKAVFTRAPKAQGRGMKFTNSPVHNVAISHNIDVFTPKSLKSQEIRGKNNSLDS